MKENKIVWVMVVVATVLMFLFLPTFTFHEEGLRGGYHFILNIPADHQINGPLILVEWLGIILFAAVALTLIGSRNKKLKKDREDEQNTINTAADSNAAADSSADTAVDPDSKQADAGSHPDQSQK